MATRLTESDRRALDSLLDSEFIPAAAPDDNCQANIQHQQRLAAVRGWLKLIGTLPAEEPGAHLVAATLARIQQATPSTRSASAISQPANTRA